MIASLGGGRNEIPFLAVVKGRWGREAIWEQINTDNQLTGRGSRRGILSLVCLSAIKGNVKNRRIARTRFCPVWKGEGN